MTGTRTGVLTRPEGGWGRARPRSTAALPAVIVVQGAALAVLAGLDGSPVWRVARVLGVIAVTGLAAWFTWRVGRAARGGTALVLGTAGTVVGAGVTGAQATAGLGTTAVVAGFVLATGLVLLVWGVALLVRAMRGWWRLLAIPAALALLWFAVFPVATAVFATNRPPGALGSATPASYGLPYRDVAFRAGDGVRLSGWFIAPRNGAAVLLLPGAGSTRAAVLGQGAVLASHGFGALLLDGRGHGRSGGHTMDFGWWGGPDIAAAVSFLARQPGVRPDKIAVLGESMGGEQAIAAMGADPQIRAVIGEGVTGEQLADHGWMMHGITGVLDTGMEWVMYTAAGLISGAPRPMAIPDAIRAAAPRQVLIIAGGAVTSEPIAARWFQAASPATVHIWVVPGAGHTQGLATAPRPWAARVISFLNTALHPAITASPGTGTTASLRGLRDLREGG